MAKKPKETRMQKGQSWVAFLGLISSLTIGIQMDRPEVDFSNHPIWTFLYATIWILDVPVAALMMLVWGFGSNALNRLSDRGRFRFVLACWVPFFLTMIVLALGTLISVRSDA